MLEGVKLVSGVEPPVGGSEEGEPVMGVGWGGYGMGQCRASEPGEVGHRHPDLR